MSRYWLLSMSILCAGASYADESVQPEQNIDVPDPLQTEVEFGYQAHTGNTVRRSLNARLSAEYTSGRHRSNGEWKYYNLYKDGEEDKRSSTYTLQSDYKFGPKTYLYGSFKGVDSRYTAYFKDFTFSGGVGYQFAYTKDYVLEVELGPGYRYQEPNLDEIDDDDIVFPDIVREGIFRGNLKSTWHALDNLSLSADITLVSGKSNTSIDSDLSVTNAITEDIALRLTHSRQYHNRVPEGLSKADSIFSLKLLFVF